MKTLGEALKTILLLLLLTAIGTARRPAARATTVQLSPASPAPYRQPQLQTIENHRFGYRLTYPVRWEARLTIENHDDKPLGAMRQRITLFGPPGAEVNVDVWNNPEHLTTTEWFNAVLGWVLNSPGIEVEWTGYSVAGESAITFHQPRPDGGILSWSTVFLRGTLAFRIEYVAGDDGNSLPVYQSILQELAFIPILESQDWTPNIPTGYAQKSPTVPSCCGISDPDNPFPCSCTWYARYRWDHTNPQPKPHGLQACYGNAYEWYPQAVNAGYSVGTTPACGSVVIFQPNMCQHGWCTGGLGHVAYVPDVSGNDFDHWSFDYDDTCDEGYGPGSKDTTSNPTSGYPNVAFIYYTNPCCCSQDCSLGLAAQVNENQACVSTDGTEEIVEVTKEGTESSNSTEPMPLTPAPVDSGRAFDLAISPIPMTPKPIGLKAAMPRIPPASASYRIPRSVFGTGSSRRTSVHYVMQGTSGQTTGVDQRESSHYVLQSGYWGGWTHGLYNVYLPVVLRQF